MEEGLRDGSITTSYPRELAELIALLPNLWFAPSVYPGSREDLLRTWTERISVRRSLSGRTAAPGAAG